MASAVDAAGDPIPTSAVLMSSSKHIANMCRSENVAYLQCKRKDPNPEKCLEKGQQVTRCVLSLLKDLHQRCTKEMDAYVGCMVLTGYGIGVFSYMANVGNEKDFQVALQRLCGKDADISDEAAEIIVFFSLFSLRIWPLVEQSWNHFLCLSSGHKPLIMQALNPSSLGNSSFHLVLDIIPKLSYNAGPWLVARSRCSPLLKFW
ncbi:NADH dehydrogenase [ubiquinone] 1 alpha subcomplex subunit 8-B, partial [Cucurbita argyrosperma subsp. sororia]